MEMQRDEAERQSEISEPPIPTYLSPENKRKEERIKEMLKINESNHSFNHPPVEHASDNSALREVSISD
jgi:hypothetical protein